jgi:hypothetical protein
MQLSGDRDPRRSTPEDAPDGTEFVAWLVVVLLALAVVVWLVRLGGLW